MRNSFIAVSVSLLLIACKKENTEVPAPVPPPDHPQMIYKDLQNAEVKYLKTKTIDVDGDGALDFYFGVMLVGDPVLQRDRLQFYANSVVKRNLLNNAQDESPVLNKYDVISKNHPGYTWWEISAIVLAEKITDNNGSYWQGLWKDATHKYLPLQMEKAGKLYHGWLELSFNTAEEKLILHKVAMSQEEDKSVQAGI